MQLLKFWTTKANEVTKLHYLFENSTYDLEASWKILEKLILSDSGRDFLVSLKGWVINETTLIQYINQYIS